MSNFKKTKTCGECGIRLGYGKKKRESFLGKTFGFMEVLKETPAGVKGYLCECICLICLEIKENVRLNKLKAGEVISCGCYGKAMTKAGLTNKRHGFSPKGNENVCYKRLVKMISRCHNPEDPAYPDYGGRGIYVAEEWRGLTYDCIASFREYIISLNPDAEHMLKYEDYEIDRWPDNDDGYRRGNIRLALPPDQGGNKRNNVKGFYDGEWVCAAKLYRVLKPKMCIDIFRKRIKNGEDPVKIAEEGTP